MGNVVKRRVTVVIHASKSSGAAREHPFCPPYTPCGSVREQHGALRIDVNTMMMPIIGEGNFSGGFDSPLPRPPIKTKSILFYGTFTHGFLKHYVEEITFTCDVVVTDISILPCDQRAPHNRIADFVGYAQLCLCCASAGNANTAVSEPQNLSSSLWSCLPTTALAQVPRGSRNSMKRGSFSRNETALANSACPRRYLAFLALQFATILTAPPYRQRFVPTRDLVLRGEYETLSIIIYGSVVDTPQPVASSPTERTDKDLPTAQFELLFTREELNSVIFEPSRVLTQLFLAQCTL